MIEKEKDKKFCRRFLSPFKTLFIWLPQCNTAVRTSCMHERINFRRPLATCTFPRKIKKKTHTRNNTVSQDRRKKIETFRGILLKERKVEEGRTRKFSNIKLIQVRVSC